MGLRWAWRGQGERVQRARAAGPTLTGTLETCVLGGSQPLAQGRRGLRGDQEPDHVLPPHLWSWEIQAPSPARGQIPGTSLPSSAQLPTSGGLAAN